MALVAGFAVPAAQAGEAPKKNSPGKKAGAGKKKANCKKKGGCKKKGSGKVGAKAADCGSPGGASECFIDVWVNQGSPTTGAICDSFDRGSGVCIGSSTGTSGWR